MGPLVCRAKIRQQSPGLYGVRRKTEGTPDRQALLLESYPSSHNRQGCARNRCLGGNPLRNRKTRKPLIHKSFRVALDKGFEPLPFWSAAMARTFHGFSQLAKTLISCGFQRFALSRSLIVSDLFWRACARNLFLEAGLFRALHNFYGRLNRPEPCQYLPALRTSLSSGSRFWYASMNAAESIEQKPEPAYRICPFPRTMYL